MKEFGDLITDLHLVDLQTNKNSMPGTIEREEPIKLPPGLDQFLMSEQVISRDIFFKALILRCMGYDHWTIHLDMDLKIGPDNHSFGFESFWLRNPNLMKKREGWWNNSEEKARNHIHTFQLNLL